MRQGAWSALAAAAVLAAAGGAEAKIVISNWDGYMPADLLEKFTAETGIETEFSVHATNEEIMGKLMGGGGAGFDLVFVSGQFAEILAKQGMAATLDHAKIPNLANLYKEATELPYDPGNQFSVPYAWGTTGLCYRSDLMAEAPDSWNDLLSPPADADGKTTMLATDRWLLAAGFLAQGHSVNTTDPAEIGAARDALIAGKQHLLAYDDTTFFSRLVSGEAVLAHAWDGWCNYAIAENADVRFVIPEEGSDLWVDTMVVLSSSANADEAHAFIDYILRPEVQAWVSQNILYKVPNQAAMESLDPSLVDSFPNMGMTPADLLKLEQLRDVGEAQRDYTRAVTEILAAQ
jgi:spermidine/putrescine transport system substrate-binding protein